MSFFSQLGKLFSPGVQEVVFHSELSDPIAVLKESKEKQKMRVLKELSRYHTPVCSHDFLQDTGIWSADKRLSDLKKDGLCTLEIRREGRVNRGYWLINSNGKELLSNTK